MITTITTLLTIIAGGLCWVCVYMALRQKTKKNVRMRWMLSALFSCIVALYMQIVYYFFVAQNQDISAFLDTARGVLFLCTGLVFPVFFIALYVFFHDCRQTISSKR